MPRGVDDYLSELDDAETAVGQQMMQRAQQAAATEAEQGDLLGFSKSEYEQHELRVFMRQFVGIRELHTALFEYGIEIQYATIAVIDNHDEAVIVVSRVEKIPALVKR